jgi:rhodanese-related sulfurtransferase
MVDYKQLFVFAVVAIFAGGLAAYFVVQWQEAQPRSNAQLISEFYDVENAVHVSPHSLRKMMDKGDHSFVLVDLRSAEEYNASHIIGAVNIPAYKDKDTSDYGAVDRIVGAFKALPKDRDIITYCYSMPCMTSRKVGKMLEDHGIYVKALGIGWNEWRYFWNLWNHEHEWNATSVDDYIWSGPEPGVPKLKLPAQIPEGANCADGQFGC